MRQVGIAYFAPAGPMMLLRAIARR